MKLAIHSNQSKATVARIVREMKANNIGERFYKINRYDLLFVRVERCYESIITRLIVNTYVRTQFGCL